MLDGNRYFAEFPDEVEHVWSRCGVAEVATDPMGIEETDMFIALKPRDRWKKAATQDKLVAEMARAVKVLPGQINAFTQPIEQRSLRTEFSLGHGSSSERVSSECAPRSPVL